MVRHAAGGIVAATERRCVPRDEVASGAAAGVVVILAKRPGMPVSAQFVVLA